MSDDKNDTDDTRQVLDSHLLVPKRGTSHRRGSEVSETSQLSNLASSPRRSKRTRASRPLQTEDLDRRMKKVYPKVRTGCDTCKVRKIKCDETKPECRNCTKSRRECLGYHPPTAKIFEPSGSIARSDSDMAHEARATEYFKKETAVRLASYRPLHLSLDFWQKVVPALAVDNGPIRHAMLTLSATQEEYESDVSGLMLNEWSKSLRQHTRAVRELWSGIAAASISNEATLICCLLLTLYDIWHFGLPSSFTHIFGGFQHVFGGLKVCKFIKKTSPSKSPLPETTDINGAMMIPAFEHLADCAFVLLDEVDEDQSMILQEFALNLEPLIAGQFSHADEAVGLMDRVLRQIAKLKPGDAGTVIDNLQDYLSTVLSTLEQSLLAAEARNDPVAEAEFRVLLVHHRAAVILLAGHEADSEVVYNNYSADFDFLINEIEDLLKTGSAIPEKRVCIGMVPPLFLAATKCRDNSIRRRALAALHQSPHHEHLWTSCTARQIAQQVIWLEETGDGARIRLQGVGFDPSQSQIELQYDVQGVRSTRSATSTFFWERTSDAETSAPPESFSMPQRMLQVCGYSAPILTFQEITCHCSPATQFDFTAS